METIAATASLSVALPARAVPLAFVLPLPRFLSSPPKQFYNRSENLRTIIFLGNHLSRNYFLLLIIAIKINISHYGKIITILISPHCESKNTLFPTAPKGRRWLWPTPPMMCKCSNYLHFSARLFIYFLDFLF